MKKTDGNAVTLVTLDDIDHASRSQAIFPGFGARLETLYRKDNIEENHRILLVSYIVGLFLYDSIIISDYFVTKNDFAIYAIGRFLICTPVCIMMMWMMRFKNHTYEVFVGIIPLSMTATLSILLMLSQGGYRADYLFGDLLVMICGCVVSRPRIRYAIPTVLAQYAMYQAVVLMSDIVESDTLIIDSMFGICAVVVGLITAYALDHIGRRAFLMSLRVQLLNQKLTAMTLTDPLTRLGNRRLYDEAVERFWASPLKKSRSASFILIDIDRFKSYNDSYGHSAGDFCLSRIACCIADQMRQDRDVAVRFGGEEFLVFLTDTDFIAACEVAERIRLAILAAAIPHPVIAADAVVSASLGVATAPTTASTSAELIIRADSALYSAKKHGRNRVWPPIGLASPPSTPDASERLPAVA